MDRLFLSKVIGALVENGVLFIDDPILLLFDISRFSSELTLLGSYLLIRRVDLDADIVLGVLSQVDFADFEARCAVSCDVGRTKAHCLVTVKVHMKLLVINCLLQDSLDSWHPNGTAKNLNLVDLVSSEA